MSKKLFTWIITGLAIAAVGIGTVVACNKVLLNRTGLTLSLDFGNNNGTDTVFETSGNGLNATQTGTVTFTDSYVEFPGAGNNYLTSSGSGVFGGSEVTIAVKFVPDFEADDGVGHMFFDATNGSRYAVIKHTSANSNVLRIIMGNDTVANVALASYQAYWKTGEENILMIVADDDSDGTAHTDVWLNGHKVLDGDTTAWTATDPATIYYGIAYNTSSNFFDGKFCFFRVWSNRLSDLEVERLSEDRVNGTVSAVRSGLVGYWSMDSDDLDGSVIFDNSGFGNDGTGTNINADDLVTGKVNEAIDFDGSTEHIAVGDDFELRMTGDITFVGWVNWAAWADDHDSFLEKGDHDTNGVNYLFGKATSLECGQASLKFVYSDGSFRDTCESSGWTATPGRWYQVGIVVRKTAAEVDFYIDGVLQSTASCANSCNYGTNTENLSMGENTSNSEEFAGDLDEIRLYNRALSASEIENLYESTRKKIVRSFPRGGLVGYWNMDDNDSYGTSVYDKSGNGNDGVKSGAGGTNNTPQSTTGILNEGLNFDGTDDMVKMSSQTNYNFSEFTISAWVKPESTSMDWWSKIVEKDYSGAVSPYISYALELYQDQEKFAMEISTGGTITAIAGGTTFAVSQWYHVVGVWTGSQMLLYVNGESDAAPVSKSGTLDFDNTKSLRIGLSRSESSEEWVGDIDEVRMYNRAFSASEVKDLYNYTRVHYVNYIR